MANYYGGGYGPGILYVKREDVVEYVKAQQRNAGWVLLILPVIFLLIQFGVGAFVDMSQQTINGGVWLEMLVFLVAIVYGANMLNVNSDYSSLVVKLREYKQGEMVHVKDLRPWLNTDKSKIAAICMFAVMAAAVYGMVGQFSAN